MNFQKNLKYQELHCTLGHTLGIILCNKNLQLAASQVKPHETETIPLIRPSSSNDLALSKIASRSRLTECIDIAGARKFSLLERPFLWRVLSAMALVILGVSVRMSIPWNTWSAASKFPFWYSSRPNNALASCNRNWISSHAPNRRQWCKAGQL